MNRMLAPLALLIVFSLPLSAAQRTFGINFTGGSSATGGGPASLDAADSAGVIAKKNWNNAASEKGTLSNLNDDSGKATGAAVNWTSSNTWSLNIPPTEANNKLMKGYIDTNNDTITTVTVSNIPADIAAAGYDVIVYCDGENTVTGNGGTRRGKYTIGSTTQVNTDATGVDFGGAFTESREAVPGNYLRFTGLKDARFTLSATPEAEGPVRRAPINAIQIVSPGTAKAAGAATPAAAAEPAFTSRDINAIAGSTTPLGANGFEIKGAGTDIWLERDGFRFVYQVCKGDFELRVRVASIEITHEWAKAGLMVRQSAAEDAIHLSLVASAEKGVHIQRRMESGQLSFDSDAGAANFPNTWLRLVRSGRSITCFTSSDGERWREVGGMEMGFSGPVVAGLAVCSHDPGRLCRAEFRNFSLKTEPGTFAAALLDAAAHPDATTAAPAERPVAEPEARRTAPIARAAAEYTATDPKLAAALASGAAKLAADGKDEKARDMCYKALANDESCAEALYELGKLLEKGGSPVFAAEFLTRASRELARLEGSNPAMGTKRQDSDRRLLKLNPYSMRLSAVYADYATDISAALKKSPDAFTQDEALDRIRSLRLADFVAPDKLPKIDKPIAAGSTPKTPGPSTGPGPGPMMSRPRPEGVTNVPVDVERALKAAGWAKITGTWKKKAENVYEVSDGKLEAAMTNGAIQVTVHKGGTGSVKAVVRNSHSSYESSSYYSYGSGYGVRVEGSGAKMYTPYNYSGMIYRPYAEREIPLSEALPKSISLITIMDGNLEITINGKREHRSNYKLNKDGPFAIEIDGTMTIESPQAKGQ